MSYIEYFFYHVMCSVFSLTVCSSGQFCSSSRVIDRSPLSSLLMKLISLHVCLHGSFSAPLPLKKKKATTPIPALIISYQLHWKHRSTYSSITSWKSTSRRLECRPCWQVVKSAERSLETTTLLSHWKPPDSDKLFDPVHILRTVQRNYFATRQFTY